MAKVMWIGEDDLHKSITPDGRTIESAGPSFTVWGGVKFPKGEAVELDNPVLIAKAKGNQFFVVDDDDVQKGADLDLPTPVDLKDGYTVFQVTDGHKNKG